VTTWTVQATVKRIVDGDTFVADLDLGWGVWRLEVTGAVSRIRVLGVQAPERGDPRWAEGKAFLETMLPVGSVCWVESMALDSFGRALCNVSLLDGQPLRPLYPLEWQVP
jgi:micrococcal nuclease